MPDIAGSVTTDWLSFTFHWNTQALAPHRIVFLPERIAHDLTNHAGAWVPEKPSLGYPIVLSAAGRPGLRVMVAEYNSPMGVHVSWSGRALGTVEPRSVLRQSLAMGGVCRRIDIAYDIPDDIDYRKLYNLLESGHASTSAKKHSIIESNSGTTVYVGSRTSEKFLRIYDKAAEAGLSEPLCRAEMEFKGETAEGIAKYVDRHAYEGILEVMHSFCSFPSVAWWEKWFTSPPLLEGIPRKEKTRNTVAWLMDSVAPALARLIGDDHAAYVRFMGRVLSLANVQDGVGEVDIFDGKADF